MAANGKSYSNHIDNGCYAKEQEQHSAAHNTELQDFGVMTDPFSKDAPVYDFRKLLSYCKERNIRYLITDPEFTFSANESGTEFNGDFFAENLTQVAAFNQSGTRVYKIY